MELLAPSKRCPYCFRQSESIICLACRETNTHFTRFAALFDAFGPPLSLLHSLLHEKQYYLIDTFVSWIIIQLHALKWPQIDLIVPPRFSLFNNSQPLNLLTKSLSKQMNCIPFQLKEIENKRLLMITHSDTSKSTLNTYAQQLRQHHPKSIYALALTLTEA